MIIQGASSALRLLTKCPLRREQADRKDAVNTSMWARAAPPRARTLYSSAHPPLASSIGEVCH